MDLIIDQKRSQTDTPNMVLITNVDEAWGKQLELLWNNWTSFTPNHHYIKLVEEDSFKNEHTYDNLLLFDITHKGHEKQLTAKVNSMSRAVDLIHFWNKNKWVVASELKLKLVSRHENGPIYFSKKQIILKSNFDKELFVEQVIATDLELSWAEKLVELWNDKYWTNDSETFLAIEDMTYVTYDGYRENGYY